MQIFYTVRKGDTLYNIASRWQVPVESLVYMNHIREPNLLQIGSQLSMPMGITSYVVKPGDTLFKISSFYGISLDTLINANNISPPYTIYPDQVLTVPAGVPWYTVRKGDTLFSIARRYNTSSSLIFEANNLETPIIHPGTNLKIPFSPDESFNNLVLIIFDDINHFLIIYNGFTGGFESIKVPDGGDGARIFVSPNGKHISYVSNEGIIYVIDKDTEEVSSIDKIDVPGFVSWSKHGNRIVYSNNSVIRLYNVLTRQFETIERPLARYVQFLDEASLLFESGMSIYKLNLIDNTEERVFQFSNPINDVLASPDGSWFLFTSPGASISEIYTVNLNDGSLNKLPSGQQAKNFNPVWSHDSSRIAYSETVFENGRYYSIIRITEPVGNLARKVAISNSYATPLVWSKNSQNVAYMSGRHDLSVFTEVWSVNTSLAVPKSILTGFTFIDFDM